MSGKSETRKGRFIRWTVVLGLLGLAVFAWFWCAPRGPSASFAQHVFHRLPTGWAAFLARTAPQVTFEPAAVSFTFAVGAVAFLLTRWVGQSCSPAWTWRSTLAVVLAPVVLFAIVLAASGITARVPSLWSDATLHTEQRSQTSIGEQILNIDRILDCRPRAGSSLTRLRDGFRRVLERGCGNLSSLALNFSAATLAERFETASRTIRASFDSLFPNADLRSREDPRPFRNTNDPDPRRISSC